MNLTWVQYSFLPYTKRMGLSLLKDDIRFIERSLPNFPEGRQKSIMKQYVDEWMSHRGQGAGRRAANTFLRELCELRRDENMR